MLGANDLKPRSRCSCVPADRHDPGVPSVPFCPSGCPIWGQPPAERTKAPDWQSSPESHTPEKRTYQIDLVSSWRVLDTTSDVVYQHVHYLRCCIAVYILPEWALSVLYPAVSEPLRVFYFFSLSDVRWCQSSGTQPLNERERTTGEQVEFQLWLVGEGGTRWHVTSECFRCTAALLVPLTFHHLYMKDFCYTGNLQYHSLQDSYIVSVTINLHML